MNLIQYKYVRVTNKNTFKIKHGAISPRLHHPPSLLADRKVAQPKGTGNKRNIQFGRDKGWLWVQPEKKSDENQKNGCTHKPALFTTCKI